MGLASWAWLWHGTLSKRIPRRAGCCGEGEPQREGVHPDRHDRAGGYADIAQYIGYVLKSGKVTGIGVGETSVPTAH